MPLIRTARREKRTLSYRGKKHIQNNARPLFFGFLAFFLVGFLWIIGKLLLNVSSETKDDDSGFLFLQKNKQPFPQHPIDLWPHSLADVASSAAPLLIETFFPSCLPNNINGEEGTPRNCQAPNDNYLNVLRIQTTPTVTGQAVANLLGDFLLSKPHWEVNIRTFASQPLPPEGWIVHVAVLPPLLEAMDLILHVQTEQDEQEGAWKQMIEYTILRVLQHHCNFATAVQRNRAVWSVSLNEVVGFPSAALVSLYDFLEIPEKAGEVSSSAAALTVLERIKNIITWFEKNGSSLTHPEWDQRVNEIIETSIRHVAENNNCILAPKPPNKLAQRVDSALLGTLDCTDYPSIGLCRHMHT